MFAKSNFQVELMHELMTARIRVHNLDLPELATLSERGQPCPLRCSDLTKRAERGQPCPPGVVSLAREDKADKAVRAPVVRAPK